MSSHVITVAGFVAFAVARTALNLLAHRPGSRTPTMGALFTRIMRTRTGRIAVVAWWAWLGLHLFSK